MAIYRPGRGGGEYRAMQWTRDIAFDDEWEQIALNPPTKNNGYGTKDDKSKIIKKSSNGKGAYELFQYYRKLRPFDAKDDAFFLSPISSGIVLVAFLYMSVYIRV